MSQLELITSKILSPVLLQKALNFWRFQEKKIVFTNGCFDILHLGHLDYLSKAKDLGHVLIVGLNTDESVKRLGKKGNRPINSEHARAMLLASLRVTDAIVLFNEDTPYELIKTVQPDVLVKGNDYKAEDIIGYDIVKAKGGEVATISLVEGYSTTSIIHKIQTG